MPFTAFTFGNPAVSQAVIASQASRAMVGVTPTGNTYPVPLAAVLPPATIGAAYSETLTAAGGVSPYTFAVLVGTLPSGLSLNSSTGEIAGTATGVPATSSFTIRATDSHSVTGDESFSLSTVAAGGGGASNYAYFA